MPALEIVAAVRLASLIQGLDSARPSLQLPALRTAPEPRIFDEREVPIVLGPRRAITSWRLQLPAGWCLPQEKVDVLDNEVGRFRQSTVLDQAAAKVVVEREFELCRRWIEGERLALLKELSLAEYRARRRRIRLVCEDDSSDASAGPRASPGRAAAAPARITPPF